MVDCSTQILQAGKSMHVLEAIGKVLLSKVHRLCTVFAGLYISRTGTILVAPHYLRQK